MTPDTSPEPTANTDTSTDTVVDPSAQSGNQTKPEPAFKIGDLFTSITILISVVSLLVAWGHDRQAREKEQADGVRRAASNTLAKLERWEELSLWYYDQSRPLFIDASQQLSKHFDVWNTRDQLWKQLDVAHTASLDTIHKENIEQAYVELYGSDPSMYEILSQSVTKMRLEERSAYAFFQSEIQDDVISQLSGRKDYTPALLGSRLRDTADKYQEQLRNKVDAVLTQPRQAIHKIILSSDADILNRVERHRQ